MIEPLWYSREPPPHFSFLLQVEGHALSLSDKNWMLVLISRSWLVQCKSQFHGIIRWFALLPNWWHFLRREGRAGLLGFWSGDFRFTCTIWAHSECDLCSQMADSPAPKAAFLNGMQTIPLLGPCQAWEDSRWHSVLLKMKRPSILLFVDLAFHLFPEATKWP